MANFICYICCLFGNLLHLQQIADFKGLTVTFLIVSDIGFYRVFGRTDEVFPVSDIPIRADKTGIFIVKRGFSRIILDDVSYLMKAGDMCIYFPNAQVIVQERSEDLDGMVVTENMDMVSQLLMKVSDVKSLLDTRQSPIVHLESDMLEAILAFIRLNIQLTERVENYSRNGERRLWQLGKLQLESVRESFALQIIIAFSGEVSRLKNRVDRRDLIVQDFFVQLKEMYRMEHEVSYYSDRQYLSIRYFSYVVKVRTGHNPSYWITMSLMSDARRLLNDTDKTVKEISEYLNFPNQSYFGKWFKLHEGLSPMEFRKKKNEE